MGQAELIYEVSKQLPVLAQQELLNFAESLRMKKREVSARVSTMEMTGSVPHRIPHPDIAGKTRILGDIISCVAESDWNLPK
jgi:hypothetical protein